MPRNLLREDLSHRDCKFEDGAQIINGANWEYFKTLQEEVWKCYKAKRGVFVPLKLVYRTFSRVLDIWTNRILHSKEDRFEIYCEEQELDYSFDNEKRGWFVKPNYDYIEKRIEIDRVANRKITHHDNGDGTCTVEITEG